MSLEEMHLAMKEWHAAEARYRQAQRVLVDRWMACYRGAGPRPSAEEEDAARALEAHATALMQSAMAKLDAQMVLSKHFWGRGMSGLAAGIDATSMARRCPAPDKDCECLHSPAITSARQGEQGF